MTRTDRALAFGLAVTTSRAWWWFWTVWIVGAFAMNAVTQQWPWALVCVIFLGDMLTQSPRNPTTWELDRAALITRGVHVEHFHGLPWNDAPRPPRWHRCQARTRGYHPAPGLVTQVERCACGARREADGTWENRNTRTKEGARRG